MEKKSKIEVSRRGFLGSAAAVAALSVVPLSSCAQGDDYATQNALLTPEGKPNSKFNGVQCGTITYSFRGLSGGVDATIQACVDAGVSTIELMGTGIEAELGAPTNPIQRGFGGFGGGMPPGGAPQAAPGRSAPQTTPGGGAPAGGAPSTPQGAPGGGGFSRQPRVLTEEEQALQDQYQEELAAFRNDPATLVKFEELKKKFDDAGIEIHIFKFEGMSTDEEWDYAFKAAKILGAIGITAEGSEQTAQIIGAAAERNDMLGILHQHGQYATMTVAEIEQLLSYSPALRLNFDFGHYFGFGYKDSTGLDPIQFIDHFSDKIASMHCKDKTSSENETAPNQNQVWGQGETPVRQILQHVRDNYPHIYCDVELEYSVAPWSNSVKEVGTCIRYMREALI